MKLLKALNIFSRVKKSAYNGGWVAGYANHSYRLMSASDALDYYFTTSPVYNAIDIIQNEVSSINPVIYNKATDEFLPDHDLISLIENPSPEMATLLDRQTG
jgi:hypothetical protein